MADEREYGSDEREYGSDELETSSDDVEAHAPFGPAPPSERPPADRNDEGDDVEAHTMSEAPPSE